MKTATRILLFIPACILMNACASRVVPQPSKITLESALASIGRGLVEMKHAQIQANNGKDFSTGLAASEAECTFTISASGTDSGKLYVELSPIPSTPPTPGKVGGDVSSSYTANRSNTITVKFKSLLFEKTTPITTGTVTTFFTIDPKILETLKEAGWQLPIKPK